MARVLLVDDDPTALDIFALGMRGAGLDVYTAESGQEALALYDEVHPSVAAIDLRLPDMSGIEVLRKLRNRPGDCSFLLITAFASTPTVVEAMRLGATDYLEKPIDIEVFTDTVRSLATRHDTPSPDAGVATGPQVAHATRRWAHLVVGLVTSPEDAPTLKEWGRRVGASSGTIRNWCRTAGLSAKRSLDFARVLRAVIQHRQSGIAPSDLLNVVDLRTLGRLLSLGQPLEHPPETLPPDIESYLRQQRWVDTPVALQTLQEVMRAEGHLPAD